MSALPLKKLMKPLKQVLGEAGEISGEAKTGGPRPSLRHIEDALLKLGEDERLVLALRYYEKLTERDVASVLCMKISDVRRIQRDALNGVIKHLACSSREG